MTYNAITAVTTYNRLVYLKEFIKTWNATKSKSIKWSLIIADDGSTDGTLSWLDTLKNAKKDYNLFIINNNRKGVHFQTNKIFNLSSTFLEIKSNQSYTS